VHNQLHPTLPITIRKFHVLHGCTSQGLYESSAMFFRYDPSVMSPAASRGTTPPSEQDPGPANLREFLFFGDVESDWRQEGEEDWDVDGQQAARGYNEVIWAEAARSWDAGRLAGVFVRGRVLLIPAHGASADGRSSARTRATGPRISCSAIFPLRRCITSSSASRARPSRLRTSLHLRQGWSSRQITPARAQSIHHTYQRLARAPPVGQMRTRTDHGGVEGAGKGWSTGCRVCRGEEGRPDM